MDDSDVRFFCDAAVLLQVGEEPFPVRRFCVTWRREDRVEKLEQVDLRYKSVIARLSFLLPFLSLLLFLFFFLFRRFVGTSGGQCESNLLLVWLLQPKDTNTTINSSIQGMFKVLANVHLDDRFDLAFLQFLALFNELPDCVFVRFSANVRLKGLVFFPSIVDPVTADPVNCGEWLLKGPVESE